MARSRCLGSLRAVTNTTGTSRVRSSLLSVRQTSMPDVSGSIRSRSTTLGGFDMAQVIAVSPSRAAVGRPPAILTNRQTTSFKILSSSTTRTSLPTLHLYAYNGDGVEREYPKTCPIPHLVG